MAQAVPDCASNSNPIFFYFTRQNVSQLLPVDYFFLLYLADQLSLVLRYKTEFQTTYVGKVNTCEY